MSGMKLKGKLEIFDICFGIFMGYTIFKLTNALFTAILVALLMAFAMSSLKFSIKNKDDE